MKETKGEIIDLSNYEIILKYSTDRIVAKMLHVYNVNENRFNLLEKQNINKN